MQYAYVVLSIQEILEAISAAAHVLLVVYSKYGTSCMSNQLNNDFMDTFIDVYICAAKSKEDKPEEPLLQAWVLMGKKTTSISSGQHTTQEAYM